MNERTIKCWSASTGHVFKAMLQLEMAWMLNLPRNIRITVERIYMCVGIILLTR